MRLTHLDEPYEAVLSVHQALGIKIDFGLLAPHGHGLLRKAF
jgi:hypothetical protein